MASHTRLLATATLLALLTACSAQQGFNATQAWKRNQCAKIVDAQERIRCLREADTSYDSYKKQTDEVKAKP